ncbi:hypothetical protein [Serratia plymuthica]|nr:hypothetical protein [Serratia plymuthica]
MRQEIGVDSPEFEYELLTLVVNNVPFKDGEQVENEASDRSVA